MRHLVLASVLCFHLVSVLAVNVGEGKIEAPEHLPKRRLSAASRHSGIQARSDGFATKKIVEFIYADGAQSVQHSRSI